MKQIKRIIIICIAFFIGIEIVLRFINYGNSNVYFYANDKFLGYKAKPNVKGIYVEGDDRIKLAFDKKGFREYKKKYDNNIDYIILGDGVVAGWE